MKDYTLLLKTMGILCILRASLARITIMALKMGGTDTTKKGFFVKIDNHFA